MKKFIVFVLTALLLSCGDDSDSKIDVVKKDIARNKTALEIKEIHFTSVKLSDREANSEILYIQQARRQKYGSDMPVEYVEKALKDLGNSKGTKIYFKISAVKANPDTTYKSIYYLNDKDSIIFAHYIK